MIKIVLFIRQRGRFILSDPLSAVRLNCVSSLSTQLNIFLQQQEINQTDRVRVVISSAFCLYFFSKPSRGKTGGKSSPERCLGAYLII
jgi:hypothetical protein